MEQYLALTRGNQAPGVVKPAIGNNVNFEIKSQFMREHREDTFLKNKNDDAHEHVEKILDIVSLFDLLGVTHDAVMLCVFSITFTRAAKRWFDRIPSGLINTWDLLKKAQTKVNIFYKGLDTTTCQLLDSQGPILGMTPARALESTQYWQITYKNGTTGLRGQAVVGCKICEGAHLDKDYPLNKEVKRVEEVKYGKFGRSFPNNGGNRARYRVGPPRYYTRVENRQPFSERKPSLEELIKKQIEKSTKRRNNNEEWTKKLQENMNMNIRNQTAA
ncbi:hypothetical protein Tco_0898277 [Tanacetum coccineum]